MHSHSMQHRAHVEGEGLGLQRIWTQGLPLGDPRTTSLVAIQKNKLSVSGYNDPD